MRLAIANDFRSLQGVEVVTTLDERFGAETPTGETVVIAAGEEVDVLTRLCRSADYTVLIAPETGGILADRAALIEREGGRSLGSTAPAIALTADKLKLSGHLARRSVRTPKTELLDRRLDVPYPAVVKPRDGAGSLDTFFCRGPDDVPLPFTADRIIQPYCPGLPLSATFLIGPSGSVRLVGVGSQTIQIREGRFQYLGGRLPVDPALALGEPLAAVRAVDGLRGVVGVDFVHDEATGLTNVIEINPRPTTSYVGLVRLLPSGTIARAWLDLFSDPDPRDDLRGMIGCRPADEVIFSTDGRCSGGA